MFGAEDKSHLLKVRLRKSIIFLVNFSTPLTSLRPSTGSTHGFPVHCIEVFLLLECCFTLLNTNTVISRPNWAQLKILDNA